MSTDDARAVLNHSGIYAIVCEPTGKRYIGQASNIKKRWAEHRKRLRSNLRCNQYLQRAFNKYGEAAFSFHVLEKCTTDKLTEREQYWIDQYSWGRLFNLAPVANSALGVKHTAASKARFGVAARNRAHVWTAEQREKLRQANLGKKRPLEWRMRIGLANSRRILRPESIEKQRAALRIAQAMNRGKPLSADHRRKVGLSKLGKKRAPFSAEWRANLSAAQKRRHAK